MEQNSEKKMNFYLQNLQEVLGASDDDKMQIGLCVLDVIEKGILILAVDHFELVAIIYINELIQIVVIHSIRSLY